MELSEKEDEHIKAAGDEEGQNEVRTTGDRFFPEIREKVMGEVTNMKRTHWEKDEEHSPVKKWAKDLPDWREFKEPERLVIKRKFLGEGDWSETDERTLRRHVRGYDYCFVWPQNGFKKEIEGIRYGTREFQMPPRPTIQEEGSKESELELEYC